MGPAREQLKILKMSIGNQHNVDRCPRLKKKESKEKFNLNYQTLHPYLDNQVIQNDLQVTQLLSHLLLMYFAP